MSRFLITGGSGFLGINLVRRLLADGHEVRILDVVDFEYPERENVDVRMGDIRDAAFVRDATDGIDYVVHTAAALPLYSVEDIRSTEVDGTKNVLEAARDRGAQRVVHISSTAVYGVPDHHPIVETDRLHGVGPYGEAKIDAEAACAEVREKGLCVTILRPKSFVGPERLGVFDLLFDWARSGCSFPMIGKGNNRYQLLDVEDLCDAIVKATTVPAEVANDVYNVGATEFGTMRTDFQAVLDRAGFGRRIVGLPITPVIWTLRILEKLKISPLYAWVYETASKDSFVSVEKLRTAFGWEPKFSNAAALVRNYEWYLANVEKFSKTSGTTHRVPWKQGALRIGKFVFKWVLR